MTPERYQQITRLHQAALELTATQRAAFLAQACAGDDELRREVESLLAHNAESDGFLVAPALNVAAYMLAREHRAVAAGGRISHYEVLSLLGAGGMGEVYLAKDTRLHRKVALKLLPAAFTQDAERVRRFKMEAQTASALNHPNILTIHDVGEVEGGTSSRRSTSKAKRCASAWLEESCPWRKPWTWRRKRPARSTPRTARASCTATSSRKTSCCVRMAW